VVSYRFTPRAEDDLRAIWRAIARDNERAADMLLLRIFAKLDLAARHPSMGSPRKELSGTARLLLEGSYVVIYEPMPYGVLVVAIVHGRRDPTTWLD